MYICGGSFRKVAAWQYHNLFFLTILHKSQNKAELLLLKKSKGKIHYIKLHCLTKNQNFDLIKQEESNE